MGQPSLNHVNFLTVTIRKGDKKLESPEGSCHKLSGYVLNKRRGEEGKEFLFGLDSGDMLIARFSMLFL